MQWTGSQREAIETRGRRILVSAGAGSGKTRVLVERFIQLLDENPDWRIQNIVAVTFTERAAREMVSRIRRELSARVRGGTSPGERLRWRELRSSLDSARIGTIHSLCAAILRGHPVEVGLDPGFGVLDELESAVLLDRAIQEGLEEVASAVAPEVEVFARLSPSAVRSGLRAMLSPPERGHSAVGRLRGLSASEVVDHWNKQLEHARTEAALSLVAGESWKRDAAVILNRAGSSPWDKREQCRAQAAHLINLISAAKPGEAANLLLRLAASITLKGGSSSKWARRGDFEAVGEALRSMRDAIRAETLLDLAPNDSDKVAAEITAHIAVLFDGIRERFALMKKSRTAVDFDDLEELTESLLSTHPEARERYTDPRRGVIRALMIDEFQDVSPIQKRILWALAPQSNELFLIGDSKQSIYRFRGADLSLFSKIRAEFEETARSTSAQQPLLPFPNDHGDRVVRMTESFRAHASLVAFFNRLFSSVLSGRDAADVPYESMVARRRSEIDSPVELHVVSQAGGSPATLPLNSLREVEARLIAGRLQEIVGSLMCTSDRAAKYGDVAILLQASTAFETYEQALADRNIPYVTIAGRGFYDRQEITDLTNLLAFMVSPIDNLSLAAVLRSPMFALSDETLLRLRAGAGSMWARLRSGAVDLPADERDASDFARRALESLLNRAGRFNPADLMRAALLETGYLATLMALPHGERRVANIDKLVEQARTFRSNTVSELVAQIAELKLREAREGEATIEETEAVRIMTVHKAKGLEFPIVWIADAAYAGLREMPVLLMNADLGLSVDARLDLDDPRPASYELIRRLNERAERSERNRLFYVAATRAKDYVGISAGVRGALEGDHWLALLVRAFGIRQPCSSIDYGDGRINVSWHDATEQTDSGAAARGAAIRNFETAWSEGQAEESDDGMFPLLSPLPFHDV